MIRCERCKRCWFDVELKDDGICKHCHGKDDRKRPDEPFFYSKENHLDFGDVPDFAPALHPAEEMVIALFLRGPVVHFLRDVGKIYEELPLLPNVVILHKSQSVTLSQVVCDISDAEFASGLAYVATSRASKLKGLMFDAPFDRSCVYRDPPTRAMQMKIDDYETRRQQQQLTLPLYNPLSDDSSTDDNVESGP